MLSVVGALAEMMGKMAEARKTRVWLDVRQSGVTSGRVVVELEEDAAPRLCAYFREMVESKGADGEFQLTHKGFRLHAVFPKDGLILGRDMWSGTGPDLDNRRLHYEKEGTLAAAGPWDGPNSNLPNTHFIITTRSMNGGCEDYPDTVPFGRVVEGLSVLKNLKGHVTSGSPLCPVTITNCGVFPRDSLIPNIPSPL